MTEHEVPDHEQVPIEGQDFTADVGIAPLIEALLASGYQTIASCENQEGGAWVAFKTRVEGERFADLIAGAKFFQLTEREWKQAAAINPDDPLLAFPDASGVGFDPAQIAAATAAMEAV